MGKLRKEVIIMERKSERNQNKYEQCRLERKQRRSMKLKPPAPRFAPGTVTPEVPVEMVLGKFFGEPILLPAIREDEPMFGKSRFSVRQAEILLNMEEERRGRERISLGQAQLF